MGSVKISNKKSSFEGLHCLHQPLPLHEIFDLFKNVQRVWLYSKSSLLLGLYLVHSLHSRSIFISSHVSSSVVLEVLLELAKNFVAISIIVIAHPAC